MLENNWKMPTTLFKEKMLASPNIPGDVLPHSKMCTLDRRMMATLPHFLLWEVYYNENKRWEDIGCWSQEANIHSYPCHENLPVWFSTGEDIPRQPGLCWWGLCGQWPGGWWFPEALWLGWTQHGMWWYGFSPGGSACGFGQQCWGFSLSQEV